MGKTIRDWVGGRRKIFLFPAIISRRSVVKPTRERQERLVQGIAALIKHTGILLGNLRIQEAVSSSRDTAIGRSNCRLPSNILYRKCYRQTIGSQTRNLNPIPRREPGNYHMNPWKLFLTRHDSLVLPSFFFHKL